jgi:hypothetical protein
MEARRREHVVFSRSEEAWSILARLGRCRRADCPKGSESQRRRNSGTASWDRSCGQEEAGLVAEEPHLARAGLHQAPPVLLIVGVRIEDWQGWAGDWRRRRRANQLQSRNGIDQIQVTPQGGDGVVRVRSREHVELLYPLTMRINRVRHRTSLLPMPGPVNTPFLDRFVGRSPVSHTRTEYESERRPARGHSYLSLLSTAC